MARGRGRGKGDRAQPDAVERWYEGFRERFRPKVAKMLAVFDQLPRRPDEERWRTALEDELLEMLEAGCRAAGFGEDVDATRIESVLLAAMLQIQARIKQAWAARQGEVAKA